MRYFSLLLYLITLTLSLVPVVPVFAASNITIPPAANSAGGIKNSRNILNESSFSISKLSNGQDLNMLSIDSIPAALDGDPEVNDFVSYMFYFLFSLGIVLSFLEGYISELNGKTYSYYGLFFRTALIVAGFLSWRQIGMTNFAQAILILADKIQIYLMRQNIVGIGGSISQIVSSISGSLHSVSIPTVSSNGISSVKEGWNLNPVSWLAGAVHALTGTVLIGMFWFLFNILYLVIQLFMAIIQLIFLGLLFSLCPIILGLESIPYTRGVFGKWMKMFIEVSFWGVMAAFEQLVFFTILSKMVSINLPSSGTGMGNIIGALTFAEAVTVFIVMMVINVTVPFFISKLFDGISGSAHEKFNVIREKVMTTAAKAAAGGI